MANGIEFTGNGSEDAGSGPASTGMPEKAARGAQGPVDMTGNGDADTGGTIGNSSMNDGFRKPMNGPGVSFTGGDD